MFPLRPSMVWLDSAARCLDLQFFGQSTFVVIEPHVVGMKACHKIMDVKPVGGLNSVCSTSIPPVMTDTVSWWFKAVVAWYASPTPASSVSLSFGLGHTV